MESPAAYVMIEFHMTILVWFLSTFGRPSRALMDYHLVRGRMTLHDAVGVNCKKIATTDMKAQVPSILA